MEFRELSDFEWEVVEPLLPPMSRVGRPRADDRMVLTVYYTSLPLVVGGVSMDRIRLLGGGLRSGRRRVYGIVYSRR
jgi:transposase